MWKVGPWGGGHGRAGGDQEASKSKKDEAKTRNRGRHDDDGRGNGWGRRGRLEEGKLQKDEVKNKEQRAP